MFRTSLFNEYKNSIYFVKPYSFGFCLQDNKSALTMKTNQACLYGDVVLYYGWLHWQWGLSLSVFGLQVLFFHPGQFVWKEIGSETVSWSLRIGVIYLKGIGQVQQNEDGWFGGSIGTLQDSTEVSEASLECPLLNLDYRRKPWLTRTQQYSQINL